MRKRILATFLALCMVLGMLPGRARAVDIVASGECGENVTWKLDSTGVLTISGTGSMEPEDSKEFIVPWDSFRDKIKRIIIEQGVTSILSDAFARCSSLTSVSLPDSMEEIGTGAFDECISLSSIHIPHKVTSLHGRYGPPFAGCSNLAEITVDTGNRALFSIDGVLFQKYQNSDISLLQFPPKHASTLYTIPESVTQISSYAFAGCSHLINVIIPVSVRSIGDNAFSGCVSLTNINIPDGITHMGSNSIYDGWIFSGCSSLKSIFLPESLSSIGKYTFSGCICLTDIFYGGSESQWNAVKIEEYGNDVVFSARIHYNSVSGPKPDPTPPLDGSYIINLFPANGATDVGYDASNPPEFHITFDREISTPDGDGRADVDLTSDGAFAIYRSSDDELIWKPSEYSGSHFTVVYESKNTLVVKPTNRDTLLDPNTQYYITMGEGFVRFADGTGSPAIQKGDWGFKTAEVFSPPEAVSADVAFKIEDGVSKKIKTIWDDGWFLNSATKYNRDLAITSVTLCGAAYVEDENGLPSEYSIQNALHDFGFDYVVSTNYDSDYYASLSKSNNDYVAYTFALKTIKTSATSEFPLVAIVIKGTSGNEEWYSNFNVGEDQKDPLHAGFKIATNRLLDGLDTYLSEHDLNNTQVKFLVTGHSRGAAVANLVAAELTKSPTSHGYRFGQANVYGYTFATPAVSQFATESGYSNIFNIVSGEDFVTRVPLADWGFKRYGISLMLPSKSYYGDGYKKVYSKMQEYYIYLKESVHRSFGGTKAVDDVVDAFFDKANSTYEYYHKPWPLVTDSAIMMTTYQYARDELCDAIVNDTWYEGIWDGGDFANDLLSGTFSEITWFFIWHYKAIDHIFSAHSQVSYYSWLKSCSTEELFGNQNDASYLTFKRMKTACPVDIYVYDASGVLVASIIDDAVVEDTLAAFVEDEIKTIDLPGDQNYTVKIVATDDGTVTHTIEERSIEATDSTVLRTVSFYDIAITAGDELTGTISDEQYIPISDYALTKNNADKIYADYDSYAPAPVNPNPPSTPTPSYPPNSKPSTTASPTVYSITLPSVQNGKVTATPTSASKGTTVTIAIAPDAGYELSTLTVTDSKGSELELTDKGNSEYTFVMPNSNVTVKASFSAIAPTEPDIPSNISLPFVDVLPNEWFYPLVQYVYARGLMTGTSDITFSPDSPMTRAMAWTVLGRMANGDVDGGTPWYAKAQTWAASTAVSDGTAPDGSITREQLITMLYRQAGSPAATADLAGFADGGSVSGWAVPAVQWAVARGILTGDNGRLKPSAPATRAEVAALLMRFCETAAK